MRAIDIGIRHDDDAVVAQLVGIEVVTANAATEGRDQCSDLDRLQHFVETRFLDVQDFSLQRQDCLRATIAPLFGGAAGRVALDQEQLR